MDEYIRQSCYNIRKFFIFLFLFFSFIFLFYLFIFIYCVLFVYCLFLFSYFIYFFPGNSEPPAPVQNYRDDFYVSVCMGESFFCAANGSVFWILFNWTDKYFYLFCCNICLSLIFFFFFFFFSFLLQKWAAVWLAGA